MSNSPWPPAFADILQRHLAKVGWDRPIEPETDLEAAGIGSLETIALMVDLEDRFQLTLPESSLTREAFASPDRLWSAVQLALHVADSGNQSRTHT